MITAPRNIAHGTVSAVGKPIQDGGTRFGDDRDVFQRLRRDIDSLGGRTKPVPVLCSPDDELLEPPNNPGDW